MSSPSLACPGRVFRCGFWTHLSTGLVLFLEIPAYRLHVPGHREDPVVSGPTDLRQLASPVCRSVRLTTPGSRHDEPRVLVFDPAAKPVTRPRRVETQGL